MGWHEQGDGKLFLGINIEQGRVKNYDETAYGSLKNVQVKSALRSIVENYNLTMILTPSQSVIFRDVDPNLRHKIDSLLTSYGLRSIENVDPLVRLSMACPALPLCGLAITEAERRMPILMENMKSLLDKHNIGESEIIIRMTGCPNGCARPYMAELALVGDGPDSYQLWLGGNSGLTNLAKIFKNKVKWDAVEKIVEPLFVYWKSNRFEGEGFGQFCTRVGLDELNNFSNNYTTFVGST